MKNEILKPKKSLFIKTLNLKQMNTLKLLALLFISTTFFSCIDEPTPPVTDLRAEISREWDVTENDGNFTLDFKATITKDASDETKILISNFHNLGNDITAYAIVYSTNSLEIPTQTIGNTIIQGTGEISATYEKIVWTYTAEEENIVNVTGTFTIANISKKLQ